MPVSPPAALVLELGASGASPLVDALGARGISAEVASDLESALRRLDARPYAAAVLDWIAGEPARAAVAALTAQHPDVRVLVIASGTAEAVAAMRAGAADVVERPPDPDELAAAVHRAQGAVEREGDMPPPSVAAGRQLLGASRPMQRVLDIVRRAAPGMATVLIRGESGTGKELVARALHEQSPRAAGPFVTVHCAALPDALLESELFGHEKGAFTGATSRKPGRVEVAEGGTLFLDEIGDVAPAMQVKLLRLLQEREYERLGSTETRRADVRFLAATHRDLEGMIKKGEFREDLFYRLNVVPLWLPPLRARRDDIEPLARHFCAAFGPASGKRSVRLGEDALRVLRSQRWPGNVRQLQNFIERLVVLAEGEEISEADVQRELTQQVPFSTQALTGGGSVGGGESVTEGPPSRVLPLSEEVRAAEKQALERALRRAGGNRTRAARILGVSRATLYNKLEEHGLT